MARICDIKWNHKVATDCIDPLPGMDDFEIDNLLDRIQNAGACTFMAMREPFSNKFVQISSIDIVSGLQSEEDECNTDVVKLFLASLYEPKYSTLSLKELQIIAPKLTLSYSHQEIT